MALPVLGKLQRILNECSGGKAGDSRILEFLAGYFAESLGRSRTSGERVLTHGQASELSLSPSRSPHELLPPMHNTPVLETERLVLRRHEVADFAQSAAMWGDSEVVRHITGKPSTRAESWARLLRYIGHWEALAFGYWVVQEKFTGEFLGEVGFADYKRDGLPSIEGKPEAGWVLTVEAQGKGYGQEAVSCMLGWADRTLDGQTSVCIVDPEHRASIRLALKVGFERTVTTTYMNKPIEVLERPMIEHPTGSAITHHNSA